MSLGRSFDSSALERSGSMVPWQFRVRPALFATVSSIVAVLLLVGGLVFLRRLTGAFRADLPPNLMLMLAVATMITLTVARIAWRRSFPLETPADLSLSDQVLGWASSTALALLAVGCCYPANRTTDWLIWLPILVADQLWRQTFFDTGEPWVPLAEDEPLSRSALSIAESPPVEKAHGAKFNSDNTSFNNTSVNNTAADSTAADNIVQQLYRIEDPPGTEVIYGTLRADFVAGQRTAVVHAGFCPPLSYLPEIEAEALPGLSAQIKIVQALAHGTRLDIRLPVPAASDCQVWIDMAARPVRTLAETITA
ncbi:MAG: hypothetical protein ACR2NM_04925 [Bythopirellula sp.]